MIKETNGEDVIVKSSIPSNTEVSTHSRTEYPLVSAIVLNYNGGDLVINCIKSLLSQSYPNIEIIVVDNASTDGSIEKIEKEFRENPNIMIVKSKKNLGFSGGNNLGIDVARGEIIAFINNDTILETDCIEKCVKMLMSMENIGAVQPKILSFDGKIQTAGNFYDKYCIATYPLGFRKDSDFIKKSIEITYPSGACMLIKRHVLQKIGKFDEMFFLFHDDTDIGFKIWLAGYRVINIPDAIIFHYGSLTIRKIRHGLYYHTTKAKIALILKYYSLINSIKAIPVFLTLYFSRVVFDILTSHKYFVLFDFIKGLFWIIANLKYIIIRRLLTKKFKVRDDDELFKRMIKNPLNIYFFCRSKGENYEKSNY